MKPPINSKQIIGITGPFGSGKSTAALFFQKKGYKIVSLSAPLEKEALKRKLPITRKTLQDIGNEWREEFGSEFLVKKALEDLGGIERIVIDGIRNIGEIDEIRKHKNNLIIAIVADRKIRLGRLKKLKRREKLSKKLFDKLDSRDLGIGEKNTGLQVAFCIALADMFVDSNETIKEFRDRLKKIIDEYEK